MIKVGDRVRPLSSTRNFYGVTNDEFYKSFEVICVYSDGTIMIANGDPIYKMRDPCFGHSYFVKSEHFEPISKKITLLTMRRIKG